MVCVDARVHRDVLGLDRSPIRRHLFPDYCRRHPSSAIGEVFAFVEDARNRPAWNADVNSTGLTSAEQIGVGTAVRMRLHS